MVFLSGTCCAQDTLFTYFSKQFRSETGNLTTVAIESYESGYLVAGAFGENSAPYVKTLDQLGNEVNHLVIDDDAIPKFLSRGSQLCKGKSGEFWISYPKEFSEEDGADVMIAKVDSQANLLFYLRREDPIYNEDVSAICPAHDAGLMVTGWRQAAANAPNLYVLKVNEQGQEQWNFEYDDFGDYSYSGRITKSADGGYLVAGGWSLAIDYGFENSRGYYLLKIDSEGSLEWKLKGPLMSEEERYLVFRTTELSNGDILAHGGKMRPETNSWLSVLLRVSANGVLLDERVFDMFLEGEEYPIEYPYNGFTNNFIEYDDYLMHVSTFLQGQFAHGANRLWCFDKNLDSLWTKSLLLHPDTSINFKDFEPTNDGGMVMAGFTPVQTPQYGWILKLDSLGNNCSNWYYCDSVVVAPSDSGVNVWGNVASKQRELYPNPAVQYVSVPHPHKNSGKSAVFKLYNLQGILLRESELDDQSNHTVLSVQGVPSGVYPYVIEADGNVSKRGKLIVR